MDRKKIIIIIESVFIGAFIFVIAFFTFKILLDKVHENNLKKDLNVLISSVNNYETGVYKYESRNLINNEVTINSFDIEGKGEVFKDEYGVYALLENDKFCAYKTAQEEIISFKGSCNDIKFEKENIKYTQNGAKVTLELNGFLYKITADKKLPTTWEKSEKNTVIANLPYAGEFYIWTKNKTGVIMDPINVKIECTSGEYSDISNTLIYCVGAKINYKDYSWHVLSDENGYVKLLLDAKELENMSHCSKANSEYCYYKSDIIYEAYKWSKSEINKYLNSEFIKNLDETILKEEQICDDESGKKGCQDNDGCAGYLKEDIELYNYKCNNYTKSKVRLLTFMEYEKLIKNVTDKSWIYGSKIGDYALMNGYSGHGYNITKIDSLGQYYLDEFSSSLLGVRAVITVKK